MLLLHGLCSTPEELRPVRTPLLSLGYAVHAPSVPGYAFQSDATEQHASPYESWIDAIEGQVRHLRATHERVVLIGISAGSTLAMAAAARCGEQVAGLVLMSTPLRLDGWAIPPSHKLLPLALYTPLGRFWRYRERPPYGVKNERIRAWIEQELNARRISRAGSAVLGVPHLRENDRMVRHVRKRLDRITCPVLALHAREDEVASVSNLDMLARGLRHAELRSVILEDCFHMITIDNSRAQVVRETLDFVRRIASSSPGVVSPSLLASVNP